MSGTSGQYGCGTKARGFTLIGLMIVLALIGVLITVALPYFQNYLARARVLEGLGATESTKALINKNAMLGLPFANGWVIPEPTDNVRKLSVDDVSGAITIVYTKRAGDGAIVLVPMVQLLGGEKHTLSSLRKVPNGEIFWTCYAKGKFQAPVEATLPAKYAPTECRDVIVRSAS
ncbi:pilin [Candidatus Pandoraea novymonadis]|uniref:Fimbrial protein n=1 Tax=Candidatus Pandoraea novymonadis TaxID=1808959 RepID=A0ABX5FFB0_9BURK|nr:pilin [Candidatus Pandoraea novymonadis]PSB92354.1 Fimbrial protein [Candidatus Pandoraea novymonadis]